MTDNLFQTSQKNKNAYAFLIFLLTLSIVFYHIYNTDVL